jgi:hypothetical protein
MSFQESLEPVKYNDEGEYYIVHRVLPRGENRFFLKLRNRISEVRLDDERQVCRRLMLEDTRMNSLLSWDLREAQEAKSFEVGVKGEGLLERVSLHKDKAITVGERKTLVGVPAKDLQRFLGDRFIHPQRGHQLTLLRLLEEIRKPACFGMANVVAG